MKIVEVFTDGACKKAAEEGTGMGGWGFYITGVVKCYGLIQV